MGGIQSGFCAKCCEKDLDEHEISRLDTSTIEQSAKKLRNIPSLVLRQQAPIFVENMKTGCHDNIRETCQVLESMRVEGKVDNVLISSVFNEEFFSNYDYGNTTGVLK